MEARASSGSLRNGAQAIVALTIIEFEAQQMKISIRTALPPNKQLQLTWQLVTRLAREEQGERQVATQLSLGR